MSLLLMATYVWAAFAIYQFLISDSPSAIAHLIWVAWGVHIFLDFLALPRKSRK